MPSIVTEIVKKYYLILKIQVNNINSTATSISDTICSFTTTFNYLYNIFFTLMNFSFIFEFSHLIFLSLKTALNIENHPFILDRNDTFYLQVQLIWIFLRGPRSLYKQEVASQLQLCEVCLVQTGLVLRFYVLNVCLLINHS